MYKIKTNTIYTIILLVSATHCAIIIPLSHWQQSGAVTPVGAAVNATETHKLTNVDSKNKTFVVGRSLPNLAEFNSSETVTSEAVTLKTVMLEAASPRLLDIEDTNLHSPSELITLDDSSESSSSKNQREARQAKPTEMTMKRKSKEKESLISRILPMLVMPFLVSSTMIPMMLTSLKFMMLKSLFVGKIAIVLLALNALWKSDNRGGVYSHNVNYDYGAEQKDLHRNHYGYNGDEEYGAYVNRRSARLSRSRR